MTDVPKSTTELHFSLRWFLTTIALAVGQVVVMSLLSFDIHSELAALPLALCSTGIAALIASVILVRKRSFVCFNLRRFYSPQEESDTIHVGADVALGIFLVLYAAGLTAYIFVVRLRSSDLDETGFYGLQSLALCMSATALVIYSFHRILRPADRYDPLVFLLEIHGIETGIDCLDLSSFFAAYVIAQGGKEVTRTVIDLASALCVLWLVSIVARMLVAIFMIRKHAEDSALLEAEVQQRRQQGKMDDKLTQQRFILSYRLNWWTSVLSLPVELLALACRGYIINQGMETLFEDAPFLFKNIIASFKTISSLVLGSKLKQWYSSKAIAMHTSKGSMRAMIVFFVLMSILVVLSTGTIDIMAIRNLSPAWLLATAVSAAFFGGFLFSYAKTLYLLNKYTALPLLQRAQLSKLASRVLAKKAMYKEIRGSVMTPLDPNSVRAASDQHVSQLNQQLQPVFGASIAQPDLSTLSDSGMDDSQGGLSYSGPLLTAEELSKLRMPPLKSALTLIWAFYVTWGAPRFIAVFEYVNSGDIDKGSALFSADNLTRASQVFIMMLTFGSHTLMRTIRYFFPFSSKAIGPYLQLLSLVMTLEVGLDVLSAIDLIQPPTAVDKLPRRIKILLQAAGCLELTSAAFASLWPIMITYWTAIIQLPSSWQRHIAKQHVRYRVPRLLADIVSLVVRCLLLFNYGVLSTPVYMAKNIYSISQMLNMTERFLSTGHPYQSPYIQEAYLSLEASMAGEPSLPAEAQKKRQQQQSHSAAVEEDNVDNVGRRTAAV